MIQSFRSRLVLTNLLIILLGFAAVVLVFTQALPLLSSQEKQHELRQQARRLSTLVTEDVYRPGKPFSVLSERVNWSSRYVGERIIITTPRGVPVLDSARSTPFYKHLSPADLVQGENVTRILPHNVVVFRSEIRGTNGHHNGGYVLIVAQAVDLQPRFKSLISVTVIAITAAVLIWFIIGLYMTNALFRPILLLTSATRRMARGDYSVRVAVQGRGELAQLADSFNEMAQQVEISDRTQRDFLANASHDLRTPLTMIAGFSQALVDGTARPDDVEPTAMVIRDEAGKMQRLVEDLMQLTRLESGLQRMERDMVELRPLVQTAIDHVQRAFAGEAHAQMMNRVPAGLPPVWGDAEGLERVLRNLLSNAIRYTSDAGSISVEARPQGNTMVEVAVTDTGIGISEQDLPRIFERFYRADKSRERGQGHSGLGLAIVREIVEANGGHVDVHSEMGTGTTFRFTIPRGQELVPRRRTGRTMQGTARR